MIYIWMKIIAIFTSVFNTAIHNKLITEMNAAIKA
jgi:hypothetical protein